MSFPGTYRSGQFGGVAPPAPRMDNAAERELEALQLGRRQGYRTGWREGAAFGAGVSLALVVALAGIAWLLGGR